MVLLQRKLYFSKDPEGVQHFPGGWGGGGGVRTPYPHYGSTNKHRGSKTDRNRSSNMWTD